MGTPTSKVISTIRNTGRGSDYLGLCEICGKHAPEIFVGQRARIYVKDDVFYVSPTGGGLYGHESCINGVHGVAMGGSTLSREGRLLTIVGMTHEKLSQLPDDSQNQ